MLSLAIAALAFSGPTSTPVSQEELDHLLGQAENTVDSEPPWGKTGWMSKAGDPFCTDGLDMYGDDIAGPTGYLVSTAEKCRDEAPGASADRVLISLEARLQGALENAGRYPGL